MEKFKEKIKNNKEKIIFVLIILVAVFSRGYKLTSLPVRNTCRRSSYGL